MDIKDGGRVSAASGAARVGREFHNPSGDRSWIRIKLRVLGTNFAEK